jgi:hypothetical protein
MEADHVAFASNGEYKNKGIYFVYIDLSYIYCAHELTKFINKSEKNHTYSFQPTPSVYKISTSNS